MAKIANEDLLSAFKEMTLIELADFVKQFEETFGVTAAAPVAVAAAGGQQQVEQAQMQQHQDKMNLMSSWKMVEIRKSKLLKKFVP